MNNSLLFNIIGVGIIYKGQGIDLKVYLKLENNRQIIIKLRQITFYNRMPNPLKIYHGWQLETRALMMIIPRIKFTKVLYMLESRPPFIDKRHRKLLLKVPKFADFLYNPIKSLLIIQFQMIKLLNWTTSSSNITWNWNPSGNGIIKSLLAAYEVITVLYLYCYSNNPWT